MKTLLVILILSRIAHACATDGDPPLDVLTKAALKTAALEPERVHSLVARAHRAALLPVVHGRVGRGTYDYLRNPESIDSTASSTDTWAWQIDLTFTLDRLVFDPHELRAAETAGRMVSHRIALLEQIASMWAERRRIDPTIGEPEARARALDRCTELTTILDELTGGALLRSAHVAASSVDSHTSISLPGPGPRR